MGNDGGSIPTRRELVKEAAKALTTQQVKEVQNEQQEYAWNNDPITRKPLAKPVVSDPLGKLYNKDTIIEYLLSEDGDVKKAEAEECLGGRVKSLKDVVEVKFEIDSSGANALETVNGATARSEKWICPITNRELGPGAKAVYLVPCGHAFAGSVVKEVSGETCLQCNEAYAENDVIPILPTAATDIARLSRRMHILKEKNLTHSLKKAKGDKKRKKHAEKETNGATTTDAPKGKDNSSEEERKKDKLSKQRPVVNNSIKNASTASLTKKVLEEQEARNKRRKLEQNANVNSLFSSRSAKPSAGNSADYMTRGFSIPSKR
ncbi:DUF602-domain-containing protein [Lindgomyces ingoldianus]|uniref:DUF602-domain-containing protein n=1 Tax=Lindgomyces ingoldianus TaxID=673940 RepID=A0ACB6R2L8_9PLEO|nr:DUF602-domain-containing protein [Lindgomyces ingoldianus]KAF2473340.1 DUF602-domain-containing protein [Lindgomyces ingoldianus]